MMRMETVEFRGIPGCLRLENGEVELIVTVGWGPRILSFRRRKNGRNFMKVFDEEIAEFSRDEWKNYGGHRLWHAPEVWPRTYYPDVDPVAFEREGETLRLRCETEGSTGLQKEFEIRLDGAGVRLIHRIYNRNCWTVAFSPWCLTVMAEGGTLLVPQEPYVPHGKEPGESFDFARPLVLWQFTQMADPRFTWGNRFIRMRQDDRFESKQKFGTAVKAGWAAYSLGGELFLKRFPYDPAADYPDGGCNAEFFTMPGFLEIESLGPCAPVKPGAFVQHEEHWTLHELTPAANENELWNQLNRLVRI